MIRHIKIIGVLFLLVGIAGLLSFLISDYTKFNIYSIINIGLPIFGGIGLIRLNKWGWIFCYIYLIKSIGIIIFTLLTALLSESVQIGEALLFLFSTIILAIPIYLINTIKYSENFNVNKTTKILSTLTGIILVIEFALG